MSMIGLGTYRCQAGQAARMATESGEGVELIDTAPVYDGGNAQRALAPVLAEHPKVSVSTKIGFLTGEQAAQARRANVITCEEERGRHSLTPAYLDYQLALTAAELGRAPDLVYLHNPEHKHDPRQRLRRLEEITCAFEVLEAAAAQGHIGGYGVATWNGLAEQEGLFGLADLLGAAGDAARGGPHHLKAIQLPLSLVCIEAIDDAAHGAGPVVEAARAGLQVWASAPLHGGDLIRLLTPELAARIRPGLEPVTAALLVTCSTPGLTGALISTANPDHWRQARLVPKLVPLSTAELRGVCDVLTGR